MMTGKGSLRTFYILLLTQTFSLIGSRMSGLALGIQVFNDTHAVTPLALVTFFYALPLVIAAGFAGLVADRWDRRWVLIIADAGQAVGTILLLLSLVSGAFQLWHLYAITVLQSTFSIFQHPAFQASVTMLVPESHRDRANAIQQLAHPTAGIVAPVVAGFLFGMIGVVGIIILDLITFVTAIVVVIFVHIPRPEKTGEGYAARVSIWKEATAGFRVLWKRRTLFYLILFITFANFLWNIFSVVLTPYILTVTGSEAALGSILGAGSSGLMAGAGFISFWKVGGTRISLILPAIIAIGILMTPFGLMRTPFLMGLGFLLLNMPHPIVNTLLTSLLQQKTPPDVQGRVFAAVAQFALLAAPLALLLGGVLADFVLEPAVERPIWQAVAPLVGNQPGSGMRLLMVITGVGYTVSAVLLYSWPRMRHLESSLPDPVPHTPTL